MGLKRWMRRIERAAQGEVESFELRDGSRYYYDPASWDREEGGIKSGDDEETLITKRTLKPARW